MMDLNILGISGFDHDAAAALIQNGRVIGAAEEERFTRVKHQNGIPYRAIDYLLEEAGIAMEDVDHIAVDFDPRATLVGRGGHWLRQLLAGNGLAGNILTAEIGNALARIGESRRLGLNKDFRIPVHWIPHHIAHASSTYFASGFNSAAVLSLDFMGENNTSFGGQYTGSRLQNIINISFPHSLGTLFAGITEFLGFEKLSDEYKVMGLASYGQPTLIDEMRNVITLLPDGRFALNLDFFDFHRTLGRGPYVSDRFREVFGEPRSPREESSQRHANIASSLQQRLTETVLHMATHLKEKTGEERLCYSGGVALNCVTNQALALSRIFRRIAIHQAPHDAGASLGAAYHLWNRLTDTFAEPLQHPYLGPSFDDEDPESLLASSGYSYRRVDAETKRAFAATDLSEGKVIGWHQGRMEWGPRALGNRSILADPRRKEMVDRVNLKIKYREPFRPFAPSVIEEAASEYFELCGDPRDMLYTVTVTEKGKREVPAVVHVDGTARVQVVTRERNPAYWNLIRMFGELTGVPVVLNTSFNIKGEPIVRTPQEALRCFSATGLDSLYLNKYRVEKETR